MHLAVDSPTNKFGEDCWPNVKENPLNVRLGIATNGLSPHNLVEKIQPYMTWLVIFTNYHIPPWNAMKKGI